MEGGANAKESFFAKARPAVAFFERTAEHGQKTYIREREVKRAACGAGQETRREVQRNAHLRRGLEDEHSKIANAKWADRKGHRSSKLGRWEQWRRRVGSVGSG